MEPLLFNIFINDLCDVISDSNCILFLSLTAFFMLVSYMIYSLKLSIDLHWTAQCYIPEDRILLKHLFFKSACGVYMELSRVEHLCKHMTDHVTPPSDKLGKHANHPHTMSENTIAMVDTHVRGSSWWAIQDAIICHLV
jgi:hypothetical protein